MLLKTKSSKFLDFWIFGPLEPLIYRFKYTKIQENMGSCLKPTIFSYLNIMDFHVWGKFLRPIIYNRVMH